MSRRVVIAGGTGWLGRELQRRFDAFQVTCVGTRDATADGTWKANLLSVAETEVALAGAETVVFLARATGSRERFLQGAAADVDLVLADSAARAITRTCPKRVVFFNCEEGDEREAVFQKTGIPLSVLTGGGDDPVAELVRLITAESTETRRLPKWKGSGVVHVRQSGESTVLSVQRLPRRAGLSAAETARAYFDRLATETPGVKAVLGSESYEVKGLGSTLLRLRRLQGQCTDDLEVLEVRGGSLVAEDTVGIFEFRLLSTPDVVMTTLRDYVPAMPWLLYRLAQAPMHARSMRRFGEWLGSA